MRIAAKREGEPLRTVVDRNVITGLGRGVGSSGRLSADGIARTLACLRDCAELARAQDANILALGTSALRDAVNAVEFTTQAERILGANIEIISGEREAALTCRGALSDLDVTDASIVDIGGGSTEIIRVQNRELTKAASINIGSVRLYERHLHHDPAQQSELDAMNADIDSALANCNVPLGRTLIALAGTATSVALVALEYRSDEVSRVHRVALTASAVHGVATLLAASSAAERRSMPSIDAARSDVLVAGSAILSRIVHAAHANTVVISDSGVRVGRLLEAFDESVVLG